MKIDLNITKENVIVESKDKLGGIGASNGIAIANIFKLEEPKLK